MLHPDTELRFVNATIGHGLFATRALPLGTVLWVRDPLDQLIPQAVLDTYPPGAADQIWRWGTRQPGGAMLLFWDNARFVNHSCRPSTLDTGGGVTVAVRDLAAGDELTEDYTNLRLRPEEAFVCHCGEPACRGEIGPWQAAGLEPAWRARLAAALERLPHVPQALAGRFDATHVEAARRRLTGPWELAADAAG